MERAGCDGSGQYEMAQLGEGAEGTHRGLKWHLGLTVNRNHQRDLTKGLKGSAPMLISSLLCKLWKILGWAVGSIDLPVGQRTVGA